MRRMTAAALALACMGAVAGAAVLVDAAPVGARPLETRALTAEVLPDLPESMADKAAAKATAQSRYQRKAHATTNAKRTDQGRKALKKQKCVQRYAVRQAKAMAASTSMYHQSLEPILGACHLNLVGENVAYGYPNGRAVVNRGWMRSEGHRDNILKSDYRLMGIGARKGKDGLWYVSQVFGRHS